MEEGYDELIASTSLSHSMNASMVGYSYDKSTSQQTPLLRRRGEPIYAYKSYKMNVCNKMCYGLGGAPYELTNTIIGFYISIFLLETARIPPIYVSVIVFFGRVWDGVSDPIVAFLVSRTDTRFGILKPWMLAGALLGPVAYFCVWYVPDTESLGSKVAWYLLFYCAFQTFLTFYQMPYGTYMLFVSDKQDERESAEMYRVGIELIGNIFGNLVMGMALSFYDVQNKEELHCTPRNNTIANVTNVTQSPATVDFQIKAYMIGALSISVAFLLCGLAVIFGTTEIVFSKPFKIPRDEPFLAAIKRVLIFRPWLLHVGTFISFVMALQFIQANFVLFNKYDVGMNNYQNAVVVVLIAAFVFTPVWDCCRSRYGKKKALGAGMLQCIPMIIAWGVIPYGYKWLEYLLSIMLGSALSLIHVAAWSMVPDVIDDFMVKTSCSYETIFFTFYLMFIKFAAGITLGLSNLILGLSSGFDADACDHPESVFVLRLLVTVAPSIGLTIGYICLWFYPITEEVKNKNITILEIWRKEASGDESHHPIRKSMEFQGSLSTKTFM